MDTCEPVKMFSNDIPRIFSVWISPDDRYIAAGTGYLDDKIYIIDNNTGQTVRTIKVGYSKNKFISISKSGKYLLAGTFLVQEDDPAVMEQNAAISLYDFNTGNLIYEYEEYRSGKSRRMDKPVIFMHF